jgi:hypothetical protein
VESGNFPESRLTREFAPPPGWEAFIPLFAYSSWMADYEECPFCDRIFETVAFPGLARERPIEEHIRSDHHMVRVRKGSNYRWVSEDEVRARLKSKR